MQIGIKTGIKSVLDIRSGIFMDNYVNELFENVKNTEFTKAGEKNPYPYQEGIVELVKIFTNIKSERKKVFFIGNGGSAAIAMHMTADFMKNGGMNTYSLFDSSVTTCMGNDYGYEQIFSRPLDFLMEAGDLLVVVSSSGESANILRALDVARKKEGVVITFTGFTPGNSARARGDLNVYVPCEKYGTVESIHNLILQEVVDIITERDGVSV